MSNIYDYIGCFIDPQVFKESINKVRLNPLRNEIKYSHITFIYRPEEVEESLFGKDIEVVIIGYGNDGENEGVKVKIISEDAILQSMIDKIDVPHITVAIADNGKSVNTKYLKYKGIKHIKLMGKYGGNIKEEDKSVLSLNDL